jgi:IgA Peptidase M64/Peptidase M64 N-terminus
MLRTILTVTLVAVAAVTSGAQPPRTLRFDYYHTGTADAQDFSFDRLVVEPLPWPGHPEGRIDTVLAGKYLYEILEPTSGEVLYSRGFASIYGEWETTGEAKQRRRTFHESVRFPDPARPFTVRILQRAADMSFAEVWRFDADPGDMLVDTSTGPRQERIELLVNGDPAAKLDLLVMGDGYTAAERGRFEAEARHILDVLFRTSPFRERKSDFNVWGLCPAAAESGISRPSTGVHRHSPLGATYDAFRSERYVLSFENRRWREVAAWAPYELVLILVNDETYGGGGILGLYATASGSNPWSDYTAVHELGHHIAGLADEYYASPVAYEPVEVQVEPWEPNITALLDPAALKWKDLVERGTPLPTPWPKDEFEAHALQIQERREQIRAEKRPEEEMSALFQAQQEFEESLLEQAQAEGEVGAFEGANYQARGYYRPQVDCIMFTRDRVPFCAVCRRALERVIDLYTRP